VLCDFIDRELRRQDWRGKQLMARQEEVQHRLSAAANAEADKMAQFRALVAQGPIQIRKRDPVS
jgi:hypothetical protein